MNVLMDLFRRSFFGLLAISLLVFGVKSIVNLNQYDYSLWNLAFWLFFGLALIFGLVALVIIDPKKITKWQREAELADGYGDLINEMLQASSWEDKLATTRLFINYISLDPVKYLELIKLSKEQKERLIAFCNSVTYEAQLKASSVSPENNNKSRHEIDHIFREATEVTKRMDRVVRALNHIK